MRNHILSNSNKKIGRSQILTAEQKTNFVDRIIRFAERGLPLRPLSVRKEFVLDTTANLQYGWKGSPFNHSRPARCFSRKFI